jgi:hypothetical protein
MNTSTSIPLRAGMPGHPAVVIEAMRAMQELQLLVPLPAHGGGGRGRGHMQPLGVIGEIHDFTSNYVGGIVGI